MKIKKALKMVVLTIATILTIGIVIGILFLYLSPEFGGKPTESDLKEYKKSINFENGKFKNTTETGIDMNAKQMWTTLREFVTGVPNSEPSASIPVENIDSTLWEKNKEENRIFWFGHSAFLLKLNGKNILLDPMLGDVPSPHPLLGGSRYSDSLPIPIEKLPKIDAVLISHDHYDHLDLGSIQKLKDKTKLFLVPLGVGAHLKKWGVKASQIKEFDWWQEFSSDSIQFVLTPARHFSGRGLGDRYSTFWGSWVINSPKSKLYFSGDGGYEFHFEKIGEKYGPFDFAMIECGQYNEKWADIHMMPEQSVQAAIDLQAKVAMPIHWGAFTLAVHTWTDPVERFSSKANELNVKYIIPKIGEEINLQNPTVKQNFWWSKF